MHPLLNASKVLRFPYPHGKDGAAASAPSCKDGATACLPRSPASHSNLELKAGDYFSTGHCPALVIGLRTRCKHECPAEISDWSAVVSNGQVSGQRVGLRLQRRIQGPPDLPLPPDNCSEPAPPDPTMGDHTSMSHWGFSHI